MTEEGQEAPDPDWERRTETRRRRDRLYRRLNAGLFALLLVAALAYFRGLWILIARAP